MDAYLGEIRLFAGGFAPEGWMLCEGQLLSIPENSQLFSLFGTAYGGDGQTTFALPDLRGRVPVGQGAAPGGSPRTAGQVGGAVAVQLTVNQIPAHAHYFSASTGVATSAVPGPDKMLASTAGDVKMYADTAQSTTTVRTYSNKALAPNASSNAAHPNLMPTSVISYIIAVDGIFPSRPN